MLSFSTKSETKSLLALLPGGHVLLGGARLCLGESPWEKLINWNSQVNWDQELCNGDPRTLTDSDLRHVQTGLDSDGGLKNSGRCLEHVCITGHRQAPNCKITEQKTQESNHSTTRTQNKGQLSEQIQWAVGQELLRDKLFKERSPLWSQQSTQSVIHASQVEGCQQPLEARVWEPGVPQTPPPKH